MATWVTPQDVLDRWISGDQPHETSKVLMTLIEDAEDAVLEVFPAIQLRLDNFELPLNRLKRVIASVVIRGYKTQEYRTSFSETTGPFSISGSMGEKTPRGIMLTDEEIKTLSPAGTSNKAVSVSVAPHMHSGRGYDYLWVDGGLWPHA